MGAGSPGAEPFKRRCSRMECYQPHADDDQRSCSSAEQATSILWPQCPAVLAGQPANCSLCLCVQPAPLLCPLAMRSAEPGVASESSVCDVGMGWCGMLDPRSDVPAPCCSIQWHSPSHPTQHTFSTSGTAPSWRCSRRCSTSALATACCSCARHRTGAAFCASHVAPDSCTRLLAVRHVACAATDENLRSLSSPADRWRVGSGAPAQAPRVQPAALPAAFRPHVRRRLGGVDVVAQACARHP